MVPAGLLPVLARPALNVTVVAATTSIGSVPVGMVPVAAATIVVVMPPMTVASTTTPALAPLRFGSDDRVVLLLGDRGVQSRSAVGDLCNVFVAQAHLGLLGMNSGRPVDTCHGAPLVRQDEADDGAVLTSASGTAGPVQVVLGVHRWIDLQNEGDVVDVVRGRVRRADDGEVVLAAAIAGTPDPDAALYWLARMLSGGEDPLYLARRIVRMAVEDIGEADPLSILVANAAKDTYDFLGSPEGELALAQAVVHLATAPKSNASYAAVNEAIADVRAGLAGPVPPHLRGSGYTPAASRAAGSSGGQQRGGYAYAHDEPEGVAAQQYLPDALDARMADHSYYRPTDRGFEARLQERWTWLRGILRGTRR